MTVYLREEMPAGTDKHRFRLAEAAIDRYIACSGQDRVGNILDTIARIAPLHGAQLAAIFTRRYRAKVEKPACTALSSRPCAPGVWRQRKAGGTTEKKEQPPGPAKNGRAYSEASNEDGGKYTRSRGTVSVGTKSSDECGRRTFDRMLRSTAVDRDHWVVATDLHGCVIPRSSSSAVPSYLHANGPPMQRGCRVSYPVVRPVRSPPCPNRERDIGSPR
jgi:hypothetical protein